MATARKPSTRKRSARKPENDVPVPAGSGSYRAMIAEAAYYRAERRNFEPGLADQDWYEAEREIESRLRRDEVP